MDGSLLLREWKIRIELAQSVDEAQQKNSEKLVHEQCQHLSALSIIAEQVLSVGCSSGPMTWSPPNRSLSLPLTSTPPPLPVSSKARTIAAFMTWKNEDFIIGYETLINVRISCECRGQCHHRPECVCRSQHRTTTMCRR